MISKKDLSVVEYAKGKSATLRSYYGLNASPNIGLEPLDQLDGFLVVRFLQGKYGPQEKFYPYIAGVYNALNARSCKEALNIAKRRGEAEKQKKKLLSNVMSNLGLCGNVITTYDMWDDERYWEIVDKLFSDGIYDMMPDRLKNGRSVTLGEFPTMILGKMSEVARKIPKDISAGSLYLPAEVAEAIWLSEKYEVGWKIGPPSEDVYDEFIMERGIGIIRTAQPRALQNGEVVDAMPYIGKPSQLKRILFSDTKDTLIGKCEPSNPSFEYASMLYDAYCGQGDVLEPVERIYRLIRLAEKG